MMNNNNNPAGNDSWKKRGFVIKEIIETEQVYLNDLTKFLRFYVASIRAQDTPIKKLFMSKPDLASLCANIEQIMNLSQQFLLELKDAVRLLLPKYPGSSSSANNDQETADAERAVWCSSRSHVGPVFQRFAGLLQLYAQYACNYSLSSPDIRFFVRDPNFLQLWDECTKASLGSVQKELTTPPSGITKAKRASAVFTLAGLGGAVSSSNTSSPATPPLSPIVSSATTLNMKDLDSSKKLGTIGSSRSSSEIGSPERSQAAKKSLSSIGLARPVNSERKLAVSGTKLDGFLILPIQRVPRYEMLLKELIRVGSSHGYPRDECDFDTITEQQILQEALEEIEASAAHMNDAIKKGEQHQTLREIQNQFIPGTFIDLFGDSVSGDHRALVREGELMKICRLSHKPYYFHLLTDAIIYSKQTKEGLHFHRALMLDSESSVEDAPAPNSSTYSNYVANGMAASSSKRISRPQDRSGVTMVRSTSSSSSSSSRFSQAPSVKDLIRLWSGTKSSSSSKSPNRTSERYMIKDQDLALFTEPNEATDNINNNNSNNNSTENKSTANHSQPKPTSFTIHTKKRSITVYASTYQAKAIWMKDIRNVIQQLQEKRSMARTRSFYGGEKGLIRAMSKERMQTSRSRGGTRSSIESLESLESANDASTSASNSDRQLKAAKGLVKVNQQHDISTISSCNLCGSNFNMFKKRVQCKRCGAVTDTSCSSSMRVLDDVDDGDGEPQRVCYLCCWEMDHTPKTEVPDQIRLHVSVRLFRGCGDLEKLIGGDRKDVMKKTYFAVHSAEPSSFYGSNFMKGPSSVGLLDKNEGSFTLPIPLDSTGKDDLFVSVHMFVVGVGEIGFVRLPLVDLLRQEKVLKTGSSDWYELRLRPSIAAEIGAASATFSSSSSSSLSSKNYRRKSITSITRSRSRSKEEEASVTSSQVNNNTGGLNNEENVISLNISFSVLYPPNLLVLPKPIREKKSLAEDLEASKPVVSTCPSWSLKPVWDRLQIYKSATMLESAKTTTSDVEKPGLLKRQSSDTSSRQQLSSTSRLFRSLSSSRGDSSPNPPNATTTNAMIMKGLDKDKKLNPGLLKLYEEISEKNPNVWTIMSLNALYSWALDIEDDEDRKLAIMNKIHTFKRRTSVAGILKAVVVGNNRRISLTSSNIRDLQAEEKQRMENQVSLTSSFSSLRRKSDNHSLMDILDYFLREEREYIMTLEILNDVFMGPILEISKKAQVSNSTGSGSFLLNSNSSHTGGMTSSSSSSSNNSNPSGIQVLTGKSGIDKRAIENSLNQPEVGLWLNAVGQILSLHRSFVVDFENRLSNSNNNDNQNWHEIEDCLRSLFSLLKVYFGYVSSYAVVKNLFIPEPFRPSRDLLCKGGANASPLDAGDIACSQFRLISTDTMPEAAREGIRRLLAACEMDERCKSQSFEYYLSAPLRRISEYRSKLDEIMSATPEVSQVLLKVSKNLESSLQYLSKSAIVKVNVDYCAYIVQNLVGIPETVKIVNVHRWLVREGYLVKRCRKEDKLFKFWLFCDCLVYAKKIGKAGNKFSFNRLIWLRDAAIRDLGSEGTTERKSTNGDEPIGDCRNSFQIISMNKSFNCLLPTSAEYLGSRVGAGGFGTSSYFPPPPVTSGSSASMKLSISEKDRTRVRLDWVSDIARCIELDASRGKNEPIICWAGDIPLLDHDEAVHEISKMKSSWIRKESDDDESTLASRATTPSTTPTTTTTRKDEGEKTPSSNSKTEPGSDIKSRRRMSRKFTQEERIDMAAPIFDFANGSNCNLCQKNLKALLANPYFCPHCGKQVCGKCSKQKRLLEHIDHTQELRVCDACVKVLDQTNVSLT